MEQVTYLLIEKEEDIGQRLDNFLLKKLKGVPKSRIYRLIRSGELRVNKKRAKPDQRLQAQDLLRLPPIRVAEKPEQAQVSNQLRKQLEQAIIYEDEGLMVINKPSGIAVHGGSGLSLGIIEAYRQIRLDVSYLELVHRLDKETSGLLLIAKKSKVLKELQAQWQKNQVQKIYWAICEHTWQDKNQITINKPLLKNILKSGERMVCVSASGKPAVSHLHVLANAADACWLKISIDTGRTHQIRVHCAYVGHPVLGDTKYGQSLLHQKSPRLFLHAQKIKFEYQGKMHTFIAEIDDIFADKLRGYAFNEKSGIVE